MRSGSLRFVTLVAVFAVLGCALWLIWRPEGGATASLEPIVEDPPASRTAQSREAGPKESEPEARESLEPDSPPDETPAPYSRTATPTRVSGRVLDDRTGAAVPAANVLLRSGLEQLTLGQATAGEDGRFELLAADAPTSAAVRAAGLVPAFLTVSAPGESAAVQLGDIRLRHGWRVRAVLLRAGDRAPVAGAPLWHLTRREPALALGTTDARGTLLLADALPPTGAQDDPVLLALTDDGIGHLPLVLPDGADACDLQVPLQRGADLAVQVQDEHGVPIEGVTLKLEPEALPWCMVWRPPELSQRWETTTAAQGLASIRQVPCVTRGAVTRADSKGWALSASGPGLRRTCVRDFQVVDGARTAVLLRMARAEIELVVSVADPQGRPVPKVDVGVLGSRSMQWLDPLHARFSSVQVERGDNTVLVSAQAPGFVQSAQFVPAPPGVSELHAEVVLHPAQSVQGQLIDEASAPMANQPLQFLVHGGLGGWTNFRSDSRGGFRLTVGSQQDWLLAVRALPGRDLWILPEPISGRGGREGLRLVLRPRPQTGARLVATIFTGVAPATTVPRRIELLPERPAPGDPPRREVLAEPGQLTATGLWPGGWELRFQLDGDGVSARRFTVPAETPQVELRIDLGAHGVIQGEVRFEGLPPDQLPELVTVIVDPACGRQASEGRFPAASALGRATVRPRRTSSFRLEQVPTLEPLRLELSCGNGSPWYARTTVTVPAGGAASVVLRAEAGGFVRLRSDAPLPPGWLRLEAAQSDGQPSLGARRGEPLDLTIPWPAGEHRARITVRSGMEQSAPLHWSQALEFTVTPGATTEVRVPVPAPR